MVIKIASMKEKKSNSSETKRNNLSELIWDHVYLFIIIIITIICSSQVSMLLFEKANIF